MLKRQNSLKFFIAYVHSLYKNITATSVKTLVFSNKRCDEVLHTKLLSSTSQMAPSSTEAETSNNAMVLQNSNITTGLEKCGQSQALASNRITQFLSPTQGDSSAMSG